MIEEVAKSLSASVSLEEKDALLKLSEISDLGIRITSYNVCYTKLLRTKHQTGWYPLHIVV